MNFIQVLVLGIVQGIAELLPVSSSAHVIMAEKLMGLDPTSPQMTFLLVMLHTGTMLAVIGYFWNNWRRTYFSSRQAFFGNAKQVVLATVMTGVVGGLLLLLIEKVILRGSEHAEVEHLFGNPYVMAGGLTAAGLLIILSGLRARPVDAADMTTRQSLWTGAIQGLCLPFRGFSRSGSTISTSMLLGANRIKAEEFSFALAVVLTPPVIAKEALRLFKSIGPSVDLAAVLWPSLVGMVCSFVAGWLALKWLSAWLERGRWHWFGVYCIAAAAAVLALGR
jgi:undecaprenyl-diphosphatase